MHRSATQEYFGEHETVKWEGLKLSDLQEFIAYLQNTVLPRFNDEEGDTELLREIESLESTDFAKETLRDLVNSSTNQPEDWEIGEALAECLLADRYGIIWPWNMSRDSRNPLSSDQGADMVGMVEEGRNIRFLFGEVKISQQNESPPTVTAGKNGIIKQLERLASEMHLHKQLVRWLFHRCQHCPQLMDKYKRALADFGETNRGNAYLFGVLLRDTTPSEMDLKNRAIALSNNLTDRNKARLDAWYLPDSLSNLNSHIVRNDSSD